MFPDNRPLFDHKRWQRVFHTLATHPDPAELRDFLTDRLNSAPPDDGEAIQELKADLEATLALIVPASGDPRTRYH